MSTGLARTAFLKILEGLRHGSLELMCPGRSYTFGDPRAEIRACVVIHDERFFSRALFGGDDAAGDSFVDGDWSTPDLVAVVRLMCRNLEHLEKKTARLSGPTRLLYRLRHRLRGNSIEGSRRNIHEHYDLSNSFFRQFLDRNMVYSSAIFISADNSLEAAQTEKLDRVCRKLRLAPNDHVLEIGTGWGAFALHAVRKYGCALTTTTISREQYDYSRNLFASAGPEANRITLLCEDYRHLRGRYDKIASIEMFEAVGLGHYDDYFSACDRLLEPHGSMVMQAITMNERRFAAYCKGSDWIQRRIFPGSQLASIREILSSLVRSTRLSLYHAEDIGLHYAYTLAEWRSRFHATLQEVKELGFDDRFLRTWDYYLAYCEGAFRERHIGDFQLLLTKSSNPCPLGSEPWDAVHGTPESVTSW